MPGQCSVFFNPPMPIKTRLGILDRHSPQEIPSTASETHCLCTSRTNIVCQTETLSQGGSSKEETHLFTVSESPITVNERFGRDMATVPLN